MKGSEFIKRLRKLGRDRGVTVRLDEDQGKGSHATLWYGSRRTIVKDRRKELSKGLLHDMLGQLGLTRRDLDVD